MSKRTTGALKTGAHVNSLPRALSKLGICSRSGAIKFITAGLVKVNGKTITDINYRTDLNKDKISLEGIEAKKEEKIYLMLNKPRGLVTTASDEKGRDTVYACFNDSGLPYIFPVGRLDKASEGLLLFTNDTAWGEKITNPASGIEKTYHVQVNSIAGEDLLKRIMAGVKTGGGILNVKSASLLRPGEKNCWLEIILDEGKNRHIRKIFESLGIQVLRLVRIKIGRVQLGSLAKGTYRSLTKEEIKSFF